MTDIVERLRAGSWANAPWEPEYKVPPTSLHLEAADEIERQKAELAASQAREAKLRECLHNCYGVDEDGVEYINYSTIEEALALPTDDTALNQVMAECQAREAKLREALETVKVDLIDGRLFAAVVDTKSWHHRVLNAIALPTDDTALQGAIKQGQREILLKAANKLNYGDIAYTELRKMAEEL